MEAPKCRSCDVRHWPREGCKQVEPRTIVHATNEPKVATNIQQTPSVADIKAQSSQQVVEKIGDLKDAAAGLGTDSSDLRSANRRSREAYNAYQREYMRKRRAT